MNKIKTLKTYECRIDNYFNDGAELSENIIAISPSKARYQFYINRESDGGYKEWFKSIKVRSLGAMKPRDIFGDIEEFNQMKERRGIGFAYQGMVIDVSGRKGWIVGNNSSLNLDVLFEGETYASNCHPTWETTYYDNKMNIVKDFKKNNTSN